ncbi:cobalamin B12-binding domain-containing protein [Alkalicoccus urumqiensis]|uniref:B12-binding domain-containing protein n=1 Tax=Alkalicoccus urumqiensis TaxID=1548213 RepID=A0A2P6MDV5_ALKUR|nr:cobalamin-dependent protein [Alkalicoccus urumqiensis]PRO64436.1 hypothetical protein C6I21_14640 [Alkalicoccus urumqiensis]
MNISVNAFTEQLLRGDHGMALAIVKKWRESRPRLELYRDLLTPAMYEIGLRWQMGDITVAEEHLATGVCDFVLSQTEYELISQSKSIDGTPKALFFTVEKENHFLGLKMVSILFREKNWNVKFMQSDLPSEEVMKEIRRWKPDVVGLSFSLSYRVEELTTFLRECSEANPEMEVLVGGRLVSQYDFSAVGQLSTSFVRSIDGAAEWLSEYDNGRRDEVNGKSGTTSIL